LHNRSMNSEVGDFDHGGTQVTISTSVPSRDPTLPLRGVDDPAVLCHEILQTTAAMGVAADMDVEVVSVCIPLSFEMSLSSETAFLSFSAMVTSAGIRVPGRGLPTVAIVLRKVHLRTARNAAARVTVAIDTTVRTAGVSEVEVGVHIPMCSRQVHVPLNVAASQVEGRFGANTALALDSPATGGPLDVALGS